MYILEVRGDVHGQIHGLMEPYIQSLQLKDTKRKKSYVVTEQLCSKVICYSMTALCNKYDFIVYQSVHYDR